MDIDRLTEAVWQRLQPLKPTVLLVGEAPKDYHNFYYVNKKPYDAVLLGILSPLELLQMPNEAVCEALLADMPVYLWHHQRHHGLNRCKPIVRELYAAEERLKRLGVQMTGSEKRLITAETARQLRAAGEPPPAGSRLTPLAKDILEGKAP